MEATDVTETLDEALAITGVDQIPIKHRPRLLSDNGSAYVSGELRDYLDERKMAHTRGAPYHQPTQGKIERYHRTMKNVVKLEHYYYPWELEAALRDFVAYYIGGYRIRNEKGYISVLRFLDPPFRPLTTGFYPVGDSITARAYG